MLIASPRHRPEDLRLWREFEDADRAAGIRQSKIAQSIEAIRSWRAGYVGSSWGKDSVVLLHLLALSDCRYPIVWVRMKGRDNPDCIHVRDAFLSAFPAEYHEREFVYENCLHDEHWRAIESEFGRRRMTGIRAEESGRRIMSIRRLGIDTGVSCRPLAWWTQADIFAYLAMNRLPVHPVYAMLGGGRWPRERIRTHGIGGRSGSGIGRREWEREYYGDVLNQLGVPP